MRGLVPWTGRSSSSVVSEMGDICTFSGTPRCVTDVLLSMSTPAQPESGVSSMWHLGLLLDFVDFAECIPKDNAHVEGV